MLKYNKNMADWLDKLHHGTCVDPSVEEVFVDCVRAVADHVIFEDDERSPSEIFESGFCLAETAQDDNGYRGDVIYFEWMADIYYFTCPADVAKARIKQEIWDAADVSKPSVKMILKKK